LPDLKGLKETGLDHKEYVAHANQGRRDRAAKGRKIKVHAKILFERAAHARAPDDGARFARELKYGQNFVHKAPD
jgi:hypothetical protein